MKKKMKPIILEEYEEAKKKGEEELNRFINREADEIVSVLEMSDEEIVKKFVRKTTKKYHVLKERYESLSKKENRERKKEHLEYLEEMDKELGACLRWLDGNKDEDISFIPDIEYKKEYVGKSRDEIVEMLRTDVNESQNEFSRAISGYRPLAERVTAIRRMNDLEKAKKASIKEKMKDFLFDFFQPVIGMSFFGTILSVIGKLCGASYAESAAILGLITATGIALEIPHYIISSIVYSNKTKKDYAKAKEDLEKVGLYDEVEAHLGRSL